MSNKKSVDNFDWLFVSGQKEQELIGWNSP